MLEAFAVANGKAGTMGATQDEIRPASNSSGCGVACNAGLSALRKDDTETAPGVLSLLAKLNSVEKDAKAMKAKAALSYLQLTSDPEVAPAIHETGTLDSSVTDRPANVYGNVAMGNGSELTNAGGKLDLARSNKLATNRKEDINNDAPDGTMRDKKKLADEKAKRNLKDFPELSVTKPPSSSSDGLGWGKVSEDAVVWGEIDFTSSAPIWKGKWDADAEERRMANSTFANPRLANSGGWRKDGSTWGAGQLQPGNVDKGKQVRGTMASQSSQQQQQQNRSGSTDRVHKARRGDQEHSKYAGPVRPAKRGDHERLKGSSTRISEVPKGDRSAVPGAESRRRGSQFAQHRPRGANSVLRETVNHKDQLNRRYADRPMKPRRDEDPPKPTTGWKVPRVPDGRNEAIGGPAPRIARRDGVAVEISDSEEDERKLENPKGPAEGLSLQTPKEPSRNRRVVPVDLSDSDDEKPQAKASKLKAPPAQVDRPQFQRVKRESTTTRSSRFIAAPRPATNDELLRAITRAKIKLGLNNLNPKTTAQELQRYFRRYGNVYNCETVPVLSPFPDEEVTMNQGHGFIVFRPPPHGLAVFHDVHKIDNHRIMVSLQPDIGQRALSSRTHCEFTQLRIGTMATPDTFVEHFTAEPADGRGDAGISGRKEYISALRLDKRDRVLMIDFLHRKQKYRFSAPFAALGGNLEVSSGFPDKHGRPTEYTITFAFKNPPRAFIQSDKLQKRKTTFRWTEDDEWARISDRCLSEKPIRPRAVWEAEGDKRAKNFLPWNLGRWVAFRLTTPAWMNDFPSHLRDFISQVDEMRIFATKSMHDLPKGLSFHNRQDGPDSLPFRTRNAPKIQVVAPELYAGKAELLERNLARLPFRLVYLMETLITRFVVHEYNLDEEFYKLLLKADVVVASSILEVMNSEPERIWNPTEFFKNMLESRGDLAKKGVEIEIPKHCVRMPKAFITPLRVELVCPNLETSNRVVRHFKEHSDRFLRIAFREEDMSKLRGELEGRETIFNRIFKVLTNGLQIGERVYEFLAFSSSQLRENGCWFFSSTPELSADDIRAWMGDFSTIQSVSKYAARMGQCFSSTVAVASLQSVEVEEIPDIERNNFCFSDGVGVCCPELALNISRTLDLPTVPSAFQFRLGGCKGVLSVFPFRSRKGRQIQIRIRKSQVKFHSKLKTLEVIKPATRGPCFINRQIIIILSYLGVPDSVFLERKDRQVAELNTALVDSQAAIRLITQYTNMDEHRFGAVRTAIDAIRSGFLERGDPFVAAFLRLFRAGQLRALKDKARIHIRDGCFLMGVLDETGTLEEGQIFVRFTNPETGERETAVGTCAVARFPSFHPGDIQVVEAVQTANPDLAKCCDVIVFSQKGYRDLPSMCSGGDLDGDEFAVWWDQEFLPERRNEQPMDVMDPRGRTTNNVTILDIVKFFVNYLKYDNLGRIAHYHMAHADMGERGIGEGKCMRLAQLHSQAVDFPKSGVPAPLDVNLIPNAYPDFMSKGDTRRSYESKKVLGEIYRSVLHLADDAGIVPDRSMPGIHKRKFCIKLDPRLVFPGWEQHIDDARIAKQRFDSDVRAVMAAYGVQTEVEAVTGLVVEFGKREACGRTDVELRRMLMTHIQALQVAHRREFAKEFVSTSATASHTGKAAGGQLPSDDKTRRPVVSLYNENYNYGPNHPIVQSRVAPPADEDGVPTVRHLGNHKSDPSTAPNGLLANLPHYVHDEVMAKASAWYHVCYDAEEVKRQIQKNRKGHHTVMITFAWVTVGDVLCEMARRATAKEASTASVPTVTMVERITVDVAGRETRTMVPVKVVGDIDFVSSTKASAAVVTSSTVTVNVDSGLDSLRAKLVAKWANGLPADEFEVQWTAAGLEACEEEFEADDESRKVPVEWERSAVNGRPKPSKLKPGILDEPRRRDPVDLESSESEDTNSDFDSKEDAQPYMRGIRRFIPAISRARMADDEWERYARTKSTHWRKRAMAEGKLPVGSQSDDEADGDSSEREWGYDFPGHDGGESDENAVDD